MLGASGVSLIKRGFYVFELVAEGFDNSLESFFHNHLSLGCVERTVMPVNAAILVGNGFQLDTWPIIDELARKGGELSEEPRYPNPAGTPW